MSRGWKHWKDCIILCCTVCDRRTYSRWDIGYVRAGLPVSWRGRPPSVVNAPCLVCSRILGREVWPLHFLDLEMPVTDT